jgi:hypothetical protein
MKTVAVVAWREIIEHKSFVAAALAALVLSLVVPIASGLFKATPADVREIVMVFMLLGFVPLVALLLGASTVSGTVAAGRFGFFLSRPVPGAAIWMGKLIGLSLLVLACEAIILAPAVVAGNPGGIVEQMASDLPYDYDSPLPRIAAVTGLTMLPVVLVLVAHAVATIWRGRSVWLVFDLITLLAGATVAWLSLRPLIDNEAEVATAVVVLALAVAAFIALAGAPVVQLVSGGVDPRRQHRVFSLTCAVVTLVFFGGIGGYAAWLTTPGVAPLIKQEDCDVSASPDGRWIVVSGEPAGRLDYTAAFLLDLDSSAALRIDVGPETWGRDVRFSFSADGNRVVWLAGGGELWWIRYANLDEAPVRRRETGIFVTGNAQVALSEDGNQVAVIDEGVLSVSAFPAGGLLGSIVVAGGQDGHTSLESFDRDGTVRLSEHTYSWDLGSYTRAVIQFNPSSREVHRSAQSEGDGHWVMGHDWARDRLLVQEPRGQDQLWRYVDAETLEDVGWTRERPLGSEVKMLADGRLVNLVSEGRNRRLELLTPDGALEATVPLPPSVAVGLNRGSDLSVNFDRRPAPDRLLIRVARRTAANTVAIPWEILDVRLIVLNLADGTSRELKNGLDWLWWFNPPEGSPASWLLRDGEGGLALWDPETGETEVLAARYD